jgi:hypothetical protein
VYNTILKSKEWLNVTYAIDIGLDFYHNFTFSRVKKSKMIILKTINQGHVWIYKRNMDDIFPFQGFHVFFQKLNS